MCQKQTIFHGYKGTSKHWGRRCKKFNEFCPSQGDDEYFGHGIYFFENDQTEAYNFAKFSRKITESDICIIYALIETDRVLDFFDTTTYVEYIKMIKKILSEYDGDETERSTFNTINRSIAA